MSESEHLDKTKAAKAKQGANVLKHLGIIADGNRRWARAQGLPTIEGHKKGIQTIETLTMAAGKAGLPYLTFYVFSTENWGREKSEVSYIMKLAETQMLKYAKKLAASNAKLLILGSKENLSSSMLSTLQKAEAITSSCTGITVCFCFNYGGEQEIADATNAILSENVDTKSSKVNKTTNTADAAATIITPQKIRAHLYHPEIPDLDMVVRTSGEERLSGFMLWRAAYAEFMFIEKYFPEMVAQDIDQIITEYQNRHRRFGK